MLAMEGAKDVFVYTYAVAVVVVVSFFCSGSCCCSSCSTFGAGGAGAADTEDDAAGAVEVTSLLGFSLLKTLLIRFTYFPKLLRRSVSFVSEGPADDMVVRRGVEFGESVVLWEEVAELWERSV